jgi:hypothetical protein
MSTDDTVYTLEAGHVDPAYNLYPMNNSLHLLDAHLIFEPLLSCLGVMPEQISGYFFQFNASASLLIAFVPRLQL